MVVQELLHEYQVDWLSSGKAGSTVDCQVSLLMRFSTECSGIELVDATSWILAAPSRPMARKRSQALRAFGKWCEKVGYDVLPWWRQVPVLTDAVTPQPTASEEDYKSALAVLHSKRDRAIVSLLWGSGLRRSELTQLHAEDINFGDGFLLVRKSKTKQPRVVPMPPETLRYVRQYIGTRREGNVFSLTPNGVTLMLRRNSLLPAHAWRRGWTVHALRLGVSETSVRAAAGWSSGSMVSRYTLAVAGDLARAEFRRVFSSS